MKLRRLAVVLVVASILLIAGGLYARNRLRELGDSIRTAYALTETSMLIVEYMKKHGNEWPKSWDDLRPIAAETWGTDPGSADALGELPERVRIDWSFDQASLRKLISDPTMPLPHFVSPAPGHRNAWQSDGSHLVIKHLHSVWDSTIPSAQDGAEDGPAR